MFKQDNTSKNGNYINNNNNNINKTITCLLYGVRYYSKHFITSKSIQTNLKHPERMLSHPLLAPAVTGTHHFAGSLSAVKSLQWQKSSLLIYCASPRPGYLFSN